MDEKHLKMESPNRGDENVKKIAALFPNCVTEADDGKGGLKRSINFELLKQMLSPDVVDGAEHYEFTWVGKKKAIVEANKPIRKTLRPCKEESKNWDTTENLYIEGDNLEVLKLLQESYLGKVKMIYIDPPYNTGNDFIYNDEFVMRNSEYQESIGELDDVGNRLFKNTETNGRFHSDWCSMIYSRLMLARNLLADDGVIFISIDDNEQENLKKICSEVFGEQNFVAQLVWERAFAPKNDAKYVSNSHDYILMFARSISDFSIGRLPRTAEADARYSNPDNDPRGVWQSDNLTVKTYSPSGDYPITTPSGRVVEPPAGRCWSLSKNAFLERLKDNRIWFGSDGNGVPRIKRFLSELKFDGMAPTSILFYKDVGHSQEGSQELIKIMEGGVFDGPKPTRLLKRLMTLANLKDDSIVLDFFSGSATTAQALMEINAEKYSHCKFIIVQLAENANGKKETGYKNICEIGKERIRRAGEKIVAEMRGKYAEKKSSGDLFATEDTERLAPSLKSQKEGGVANDSVRSVSAEGGFSAFCGKNTPLSASPDIGFRVLKVADSNMKDVYYAAGDYTQDLLSGVESNIKGDRTDLDLLFGCLLDWGLTLSCPYSSEKLDGCTVHTYNDGDLVACFDVRIPESVVKEIAKRKPLRAVFRDAGFASSPEKINVFEIFKHYAPETSVKVI